MATKRRNQENFYATVNGTEYVFLCYTTDKRSGFCHTVQIKKGIEFPYKDTKVSYFNRMWESFRYETALSRAIEKCPKADQEQLRANIIERTSKEEHERCERFLGAFQAGWDMLTDENKAKVANTVGMIENEAQANAALVLVQLTALMQ